MDLNDFIECILNYIKMNSGICSKRTVELAFKEESIASHNNPKPFGRERLCDFIIKVVLSVIERDCLILHFQVLSVIEKTV